MGNRTEPHSGPPLPRRVGALAASSGHLPRGGKGVRVQHRPTHALRGARPTRRAPAGPHAESEATLLGHQASRRHQLEDGRREGSQRPCRFDGARLAGEARVHGAGGEGAPGYSG